VKGVGFDLIGTLVRVEPQVDRGVKRLQESLARRGVDLPFDRFSETYRAVTLEYRKTRLETFREISNHVWVAETLRRLGHPFDPGSETVREAVHEYFIPYRAAVTVMDDAVELLSSLRKGFKLGVLSNFTCSDVVHQILEEKGLKGFFDYVCVSDEVGWRKPHPVIFNTFLDRLGLKAENSVFVGDDPRYDIAGAKGVGMKAVLFVGGGTKSEDAYYGQVSEAPAAEPDREIKSLLALREILGEL
jgi:HAD superfamily hydrolase (TIGR01549 family)